MAIEWEVSRKILEFWTGLPDKEKFQLSIAALSGGAIALGAAWQWGKKRGYGKGRSFEVQHGQVPVVRGQLDACRHETLSLEAKLDRRDEEIRVLGTTPTDAGALAPEIQSLVELRKKVVTDDARLWDLRPAEPLPHLRERLMASKTKIITIGNLKGGVGKTTLTANLAAYFDTVRNKRVLVVDLDYQGSVSAMMLQAAKKGQAASQIDYVLSGTKDGKWLVDEAKDLAPRLQRTRLIPAAYSLQEMEDQLLARWLFNTLEKDPRFNLAECLLSEEVQSRYDIILLDVGPRLTIASLSALCASTHLIVPTNLDRLAVETVSGFSTQVRRIKSDFGLPLQLAGVVGTMTDVAPRLKDHEEDARSLIEEGLKNWGDEAHIFKRFIPRKSPIANVAGTEIAYFCNASVRSLINELGQEIASRIKL